MDCQNFNWETFLNDLQRKNFELKSNNPDEDYRFITEVFIETFERDVILKKRFIRTNEKPFMNKKLRKTFYNRSKLNCNFCKYQTRENEVNYYKQSSKCV